MSSWPRVTKASFERAYAERSGMTVEELRNDDHSHFSVVRCDCHEDGCQGWKMACRRELQVAVDRGFALPRELAELDEILAAERMQEALG
jgi:hypothetical protein